jgi:ATP-dependent Clp protease ATP-binding subunit ClpC
VTFDPSVVRLVSTEGFDEVYGARPLRRAIVRMIEDAFSTELLEGRIRAGDKVRATEKDGAVSFEKE